MRARPARTISGDERVNIAAPSWPARAVLVDSEPMRPDARAWFQHRTTSATTLAEIDLDALLRAKRRGGHRVSVVLPARNEEATVGRLVADLRRALDAPGAAGRRAARRRLRLHRRHRRRRPGRRRRRRRHRRRAARARHPAGQGRGAVEVAGRHDRRPRRLPRLRPHRRRRPLRARAARAAARRSAGPLREGLLHPARSRSAGTCSPPAGAGSPS